MKRRLAIGDIHGGFKALKQILDKAQVTDTDTLIFLGDYVDGWSESSRVIRFLIELSEKQECIFIKGNHDAWCEDWLSFGKSEDVWLFNGGKSTVESYAGYSSMHGPEKEVYSSNYRWDRTLWETAVAMDRKLSKNSELYPQRLLLYNEIFIGHTPTLHLGSKEPVNKANVWNLDTGAAFTGSLNIMDVDTKAFWQSDPLPSLYPDEKGRNKDQIKPVK